MAKKLMKGNQAFAHAALEAGLRVAAGYPGTPSSEVIETIASLHAKGKAQGVHVEWSTNEKAALELLAGASYTGARCLYTCKQVGLNVASDPLMSLNYVGVRGGLVLLVADDPGPISSQTEQDTRRFGSFSKVPVLDPATLEQGVAMMKMAFQLSETYHTPVIFRPTTRVCHASTYVEVADSTQAMPAGTFEKDPKWVIFPKRSYLGHKQINDRLVQIADEFSGDKWAEFNKITNYGGEEPTLGVCAGGVSAGYAQEALRQLTECCAEKDVAMPAVRFMQVGTPYPFPSDAAAKFAEGLERVIVFEELDHVLEDELLKLAGQRKLAMDVCGKLTGHTLDRGENTVDVCYDQLISFMGLGEEVARDVAYDVEAAAALAPVRPPILCAGCPHRGAFYAVKRAVGKRKDARLCGDIGCYTLGNAQPLDAVDTCLCMGAGITVAQGFATVEPGVKAVAFVGDSTFFASGMTGVANAVYNQHDVTICILDNATTAMTGSQPHPGTGNTLMGPKTKPISMEAVLRALSVECIQTANPLFLADSIAAAKKAINFNGPSAVIFQSPCTKLCKPDAPATCNHEKCTNCKVCVSTIGCPALSWDFENQHPIVDESLCVGCGLCADLCAFKALTCDARAEGKSVRYQKPVSGLNNISTVEGGAR